MERGVNTEMTDYDTFNILYRVASCFNLLIQTVLGRVLLAG
jgi:hypothetical protein